MEQQSRSSSPYSELSSTLDLRVSALKELEKRSGYTVTTPEGVVFTAEGHSARLLSQMASLRSKGQQLCDVVLRIGSEEIYAHRVVLSACSSYFCAMFTNKMMESSQEIVTLTDLDPQAVTNLVEFTYTAEIKVNEDNVQPLLKAAAILQLSEVVGVCCTFLCSQLHPSNCLGIVSFAEAHGCTVLAESAREYVLDHFREVVKCDEFVHLSFEAVRVLLMSDNINVSSEEMVFDAAFHWLQFDTNARKFYAFEILSAVRLPLLKPRFLAEQVFTKELLRQNPQSVELIMNAMIYHSVPEKRPHLKAVINDLPRKGTMGTMFAVGGMESCQNKGSVEYFNARKNHWSLMLNSQPACKRLQFGCTILNSKIYVVGGRNGLRTLNTVDCFNPVTCSWEACVPMCSYRHGVGVGVMSGPMYAVGGHDGWSYLSSVERYDPVIKVWSYVSSMNCARSTSGVGILNGKLYVVGGRDSNSCLKSVEYYDPHTDRWAHIPDMNIPRGGVAVAVLFNKLYAIGGHEIADPLSSVEAYDPLTNVWCMVASMKYRRDAVAAVSFGGKVYAVGGFDGSDYLCSVECYDPELNEWSLSADLRLGRAGSGVAVCSDIFVDDLSQDSQ